MDVDERMLLIIDKAAGGDNEAYKELVESYSSFMRSVARCYLRNRNEMDDVMQEVWIKVWENFEQLKEPVKFPSWLATIVKFHCIKRSKAEKIKNSRNISMNYEISDELIQGFLEEDGGISRYVELKELRMIIDDILNRIPELYAVPLRLFYIEELKVKEIEVILDVSNSTVKWRLYQGRSIFKKHVGTRLFGYQNEFGGSKNGKFKTNRAVK